MKLAGLSAAILDDPAVTRARDLARAGHSDQVDLTGPPALRAFVAAAIAAERPDESAADALTGLATA